MNGIGILDMKNLKIVDATGKAANVSLEDVLAGNYGEVSLVLQAKGLKAGNRPKGNPLVMDRRSTDTPAAPAPAVKTAAPSQLAPGELKPVKRNSKLHQLLVLLNRKNGATFNEIKAKMGWTDGAVGSYLYGYPEEKGYTKETFTRANGDKAYRLKFPEGQTTIAVA